MNTTEQQGWRRTSPFAILFFIGKSLRLIAKNAWQSLAPLFALLVATQGDIVTRLTLVGIAFVGFIAVSSFLSFWFFRFQISGDSILIRQGVINKKQLDIKFNRIQGINTQQNPVYRALGLVTVSFDTAGSAGSEGNLPAVTRDFADSLRERIGKPRELEPSEEEDGKPEASALVQLDWRDMIRIGLADRRALLVFAFIGPVAERLDENIDNVIAGFIEAAAANGIEITAANGVSIGVGIAVALILLFIIVSVAAAFLRYHNFQLFLDGQTLRSHAGLVTAHEHSMDLSKIQTLRLQQGVVQRLLKRYRLTARQAVSSGKDRSAKVFVVPVVTAALADELRQKFLAPEAGRLTQDPTSPRFAPVSPHYMRSKILFVGLLPSLIAAVALWIPLGAFALLCLLWIPLVVAAAHRSWKRSGYLHDNEEIVRRSGFLGFRTVGLLFRKVQRVTVLQSRYQRRKGLASLRLHMASGSVVVPYIEHGVAKQLRDYILFKVESSRQAWH